MSENLAFFDMDEIKKFIFKFLLMSAGFAKTRE